MHRVLRFLLLAGGLASGLAAQTSVWKVADGERTLYLGGTCHLLRAKDLPLPAEFHTAFAAAAVLCFETDIERLLGPDTQRLLLSHGQFADGQTLRDALSPAAWAAVEKYCAKAGLPVDHLARFKPWFFSVMIAVIEFQRLGVTQEGVDVHLFHRARAAGKRVRGLESFAEHLSFLTGLGAGHESEMVLNSLEDLAEAPAMIDQLLAAWRAGDLAAIDEIMLKDLRARYPAIHAELIVRRNRAWLPLLEEMLRSPEIEFVLVGAGHLAGPDGLVAALRGRGFTVEQIVVKN